MNYIEHYRARCKEQEREIVSLHTEVKQLQQAVVDERLSYIEAQKEIDGRM